MVRMERAFLSSIHMPYYRPNGACVFYRLFPLPAIRVALNFLSHSGDIVCKRSHTRRRTNYRVGHKYNEVSSPDCDCRTPRARVRG
jgi:hypothetical protein